ncbi:MAG: winged helix-turn-helix transcriptional regulator [Rhodobacteraceae bacterium]|nr:winged helix-turn-helix transcriptional regulator [Paracoccaceae bacterium]
MGNKRGPHSQAPSAGINGRNIAAIGNMENTSKKTARPGKVKSRTYEELWTRPGYLIRRLHQIHVGLFAEECGGADLTPVQSAILTVLQGGEGMDQLTLSTSVGIDRTSGADVIRRLERRGLLTRISSEQDRRAKIVKITVEGRTFLKRVRPRMARAQDRLIAPLDDEEREEFFRLINKLVDANNKASRAPMGTV